MAFVPCTAGELAGMMVVKYMKSDNRLALHAPPQESKNAGEKKTPKGPKMKGEVEKWIATVTEDTRHQWAACGGSGDMLRNAGFVGHLHDCLQRGGM